MNNEEKANELGFKFFPDEENIWARDNVEATKCAFACLGMAHWYDYANKVWHLLYGEIAGDDVLVSKITHWMCIPSLEGGEE